VADESPPVGLILRITPVRYAGCWFVSGATAALNRCIPIHKKLYYIIILQWFELIRRAVRQSEDNP